LNGKDPILEVREIKNYFQKTFEIGDWAREIKDDNCNKGRVCLKMTQSI